MNARKNRPAREIPRMPTKLSAPVAPVSDLAPRTWRGWWLAQPKWLHIGCWAVLGLFVLHVALAIRIYFGLQESPEITTLSEERGVLIGYGWEDDPWWFQGQDILMAGVLGRSPRHVTRLEWFDATDADLQELATRFPSLERLELNGDRFSVDGLSRLASCRRLRHLDLSWTEIGDDEVRVLATLRELRFLDLSGTLITESVIPTLRQLPHLEKIHVTFTEIPLSRIRAWDPKGRLVHTEKYCNSQSVLGSIRWSDGSRSVNYPEAFAASAHVPGSAPQGFYSTRVSRNLTRKDLFWGRDFWERIDGGCELKLSLGEFESEPVQIEVQQGVPSPSVVEFRMPCTKAEALQSRVNDESP